MGFYVGQIPGLLMEQATSEELFLGYVSPTENNLRGCLNLAHLTGQYSFRRIIL